ncbi:uncharacterized protein LOC122510594 isoform X1 [Leptopilina heterotoma]|uniref:uncharacterized protein LOC122498632 isoform X1 n=2 Tax=Leptopilina heterotoma TaxID=63436 RepID=UPI001CA92D4B|nr:uncharacterized protein LOC122498632 isoform X1 [Leptopilina heterotoma]XP_043481299.1 uncharacterized protein LOC122510594 isoform X1 [Leptopilina heterotoma]
MCGIFVVVIIFDHVVIMSDLEKWFDFVCPLVCTCIFIMSDRCSSSASTIIYEDHKERAVSSSMPSTSFVQDENKDGVLDKNPQLQEFLNKIMNLTVSIIHDLQLSESIYRRMEEKPKRGRPPKGSNHIAAPELKEIRKDQLLRLRANSIRESHELYRSIAIFAETPNVPQDNESVENERRTGCSCELARQHCICCLTILDAYHFEEGANSQ